MKTPLTAGEVLRLALLQVPLAFAITMGQVLLVALGGDPGDRRDLAKSLEDWRSGDVWYCGPDGDRRLGEQQWQPWTDRGM